MSRRALGGGWICGRSRSARFGEGRSHLEDGVHTWGRYDVEVDTSRFSEEATRGRVVEAFRRHDPERSAFRAAWLDLQRGGRPLRNPNRC